MPSLAATLPEGLRLRAERDEGTMTFHLDEGLVTLSPAEIAERAFQGAGALAARGVEPGARVGVMGPNRPEWLIGAYATWAAGAVLVPIQLPLRVRDAQTFEERVAALVEASGATVVLSDPRLVGLVPGDIGMSWEDLAGGHGAEPVAPGPDDPAVIQFTSGSTAAPKGALITHRAVVEQVSVIEHLGGAPCDERVFLGWVPFFHDLGLFLYVVCPIVGGGVCHQLPTEIFARDPSEWLRLVGEVRATVTVSPASAMASAMRAVSRGGGRVDLSSLDVTWFGAEGIDPALADRILASADDLGLDPLSLGMTYGLAEAVLAVTASPPREGLRFDRIDLSELASSHVAVPSDRPDSKRVVSSGTTAPGTELRIVSDGQEVPERHVGEIEVRGPARMREYVGHDAPNAFHDGWLRTGDLGYMADGQLHVTGRAKDMIVVMGHNYYPEDFEWAASRVDGVRPGRCVALSDPAERVVLLIEPSADGDGAALVRRTRSAVADAVGVAPADVVLVPPGTVEKTSSGKLRRAAMRDAYAERTLPVLASAVEAVR